MQRTVLGTFLVVLAVWAVGCNAFSSREATSEPTKVKSSQSDASQSEPTVVRLPPSPCDARLFGKVTDTATYQTPRNVTIQLVSSKGTLSTVTDSNGLYGFAGLCAGEYTATVHPPGKPAAGAAKVKLTGDQELKLDLSFQ